MTVQARRSLAGRRLESAAVIALPREGEATGPVELRLEALGKLEGIVTSSRGPVVGARVGVVPRGPATSGRVSTVRTDARGVFEVQVPEARSYGVTVSPPGYPLTAFEVSPGGPATLEVGGGGGELQVILGGRAAAFRDEGRSLAIWQNGLPLSLGTLYRWSAGHDVPFQVDGRIRAPRLAAGRYDVCVGPRALTRGEAEIEAWRNEKARCQSGDLLDGGTLVLEMAPKRDVPNP